MSFTRKAIRQFCKDNVVVLTCVPLIVGIHWGWMKLQDIPYFVKPEEKKELPLVIGARELWKIVTGEPSPPR